MSKDKNSNALYKKHLAVMIFINICPIFHWMRNNKRLLNYYFYIVLAEFEKVKNKDSEILDMLYQDLLDSKNSFDALYGVANFMNSKEYREIVAKAPDKKE
ncbi:hypothetical protein SAMN04487760_10224 [Lachnospiraceae bacterium G41]|nr:hypothetical protein SAMN04487760_10224 [Lachnospiraceae bacterium G41]